MKPKPCTCVSRMSRRRSTKHVDASLPANVSLKRLVIKKWEEEAVNLQQYSPKAKRANRRPIAQTRFIFSVLLDRRRGDKSRDVSSSFGERDWQDAAPTERATLLNPWRPTNHSAPRTTFSQSQRSPRDMLSNQIRQHKSSPENRGRTPLDKNE